MERKIKSKVIEPETLSAMFGGKTTTKNNINNQTNISTMETKTNNSVINSTNNKKMSTNSTKKASEIEAKVKEFINGRSYAEVLADTTANKWDGKALEEDRIYHLINMGGAKIYENGDNRRTTRRALKMLDACTENGMTTPAILVDAKIVKDWGLSVIDPATLTEVPKEELEGAYCIMEGHGRHQAHIIDLALAAEDGHTPFDFHFIYKHYDTPEEFGKAYVSTNADMTRTTNKDRLGIAGARCKNPLVKENLRKISEDHVIAKASYFWTYGRELTKAEVTAITYETADAPKFDAGITDSLQKVYVAFQDRFSSEGAKKIWRGVAAAQWAATQLKDPTTAALVADNICGKVKVLGEEPYTALITAKTESKKHLTREQVIKGILDKMMK